MGFRLLAVIASVALIGYFVLFVALHVRRTGYHPVRHAVSDYGVGPAAPWFRAALAANILGIAALCGALAGEPDVAGKDLLFLSVVVVTRALLAFFPTDVEGQRLTRTGIVHYLLAIASFTFVYLAIDDLTDGRNGLFTALYWISTVSLAAVVVTMIPSLRRVFGLAERAYLISTNLWFLLAAAALVVA